MSRAMVDLRPVTRDMLLGPIDVHLDMWSNSFDDAKSAADKKAAETTTSPVLLAWFDRKAWKHSPAIC